MLVVWFNPLFLRLNDILYQYRGMNGDGRFTEYDYRWDKLEVMLCLTAIDQGQGQ